MLLQRVYRDQSDLIVVFLYGDYATKQWCGLEWRVVRDIIKSRHDERVMYIRFDEASVDGLLSIDGYVDASSRTSNEIAEFVLARVLDTPERQPPSASDQPANVDK